MFWIGLVTGLFVGASSGAVIMGALVAAKRDDEERTECRRSAPYKTRGRGNVIRLF